MYAVVTSAATFLTSVQSVLLNLRIFLCVFLVLDVIKLKVQITTLWSDMPGYTETSMTVSGLFVSIRSNISLIIHSPRRNRSNVECHLNTSTDVAK